MAQACLVFVCLEFGGGGGSARFSFAILICSHQFRKLLRIYKINMANQRGQDLSGSRGLPDWGATSEHLTGVRVAHNRILHAVCCLNFRTRPFFSFKPLHLFKKNILVHLFRAREMCNQSQHTPRRLFSKLVGTFYLMFQQHVSARCTKNRVCRRSGHSRAVLPLRRERR